MPLVCPSCNFQRRLDGVTRLELCPRCSAEGREIYMAEVPATGPRRRRTDLIGLLATARGELTRWRDRG